MVRGTRALGPRKDPGRRAAANLKQDDRNRAEALQALRDGRGCDPYRALVLLETATRGDRSEDLIADAIVFFGRKW